MIYDIPSADFEEKKSVCFTMRVEPQRKEWHRRLAKNYGMSLSSFYLHIADAHADHDDIPLPPLSHGNKS